MSFVCSCFCFFFSSRRRHTRWPRDWSSDVCSSDLIDRFGLKVAVVNQQMFLAGGFADDRIGAAFALTNSFETGQIFRLNRQYIALLGFITPDRQGAHARLIIGYIAQLETAATTTVFHQFGESVG